MAAAGLAGAAHALGRRTRRPLADTRRPAVPARWLSIEAGRVAEQGRLGCGRSRARLAAARPLAMPRNLADLPHTSYHGRGSRRGNLRGDRGAAHDRAPGPSRRPGAERPMADAIRLLLADDHALFRQLLRGALADNPRFEIVGEAQDTDET